MGRDLTRIVGMAAGVFVLTVGTARADDAPPPVVVPLEAPVPEDAGPEPLAPETVLGGKLMTVVPTPAASGPEIGVAFVARLDRVSHFVEFGGGFHGSTDGQDGAFFTEAGVSFYLTDSAEAGLYVGGGGQLRFMSVEDLSVVSFAVHGQIGLSFFRSTSMRSFVELRIVQNLFPLSVRDAFSRDVDAPASAYRTEPQIAAGIGF